MRPSSHGLRRQALGRQVIDGTGSAAVPPTWRCAAIASSPSVTWQVVAADDHRLHRQSRDAGFIDIHCTRTGWSRAARFRRAGRAFRPPGHDDAGRRQLRPAPATGGNRHSLEASSRLDRRRRDRPAVETTWRDFLAALSARRCRSTSEPVGHGAVRAAVTGPFNPAPLTADHCDERADGAPRPGRRSTRAASVSAPASATRRASSRARTSPPRSRRRWSRGQALHLAPARLQHRQPCLSDRSRAARNNNLAPRSTRSCASRSVDARSCRSATWIFVGRNSWPTADVAIATIERARVTASTSPSMRSPTRQATPRSVLFPPEIPPQLESISSDPALLDAVK